MESFNDIWQAVLDYFRVRVSETAYDLWIKIIKFENFENSTVTLRFPHPCTKTLFRHSTVLFLRRHLKMFWDLG